MGTRLLLFAVFFSITLAAACDDGGNTDFTAADLEGVVIEMQRTPCPWGSCPPYSLTIQGDGKLTFVTDEGVRTAIISQDDLESLVTGFYQIDYFSLQDRYDCAITDMPATTTSISIAGRTKRVHHGCRPPMELVELANMIDEVAGASRWVEGG